MYLNMKNKQLLIILVIVFFGFVGLSIPYLIFPALFLNPEYSILPIGTTETQAGLYLGSTLAAYPLGQFLGSPILGALSDSHGRRKILVVSLAISALFSLLSALALSWKMLWLLIISRFFTGLMEGNISIARAMAADIKELDKLAAFGKINAACYLSFIIGPLLGALLSDKNLYQGFTLSTPFYLISTVFLLLAIIAFLSIKKVKTSTTSKQTVWQAINFVDKIIPLFKIPQIKLLLLTGSLYTLAIDIFYQFGPVYLTKKWLLSPTLLTTYNSLLCITLMIGSVLLARRLAKQYSFHKIIISASVFLFICLISIVITNQPIVMLMLFGLIGFGIGVGSTTLSVQLSNAASDNIQGQVMGVQQSLRVAGDALICIIGGALLSLSPIIMLLLAAFISIGALFYYLRNLSLQKA